MTNPCIKTGGWVHLIESDEYFYGDIYQIAPGALYIRIIRDVPGNYASDKPEDQDIWATFSKITSTHVDGRMETIMAQGRPHFEYKFVDGECVKVAL